MKLFFFKFEKEEKNWQVVKWLDNYDKLKYMII